MKKLHEYLSRNLEHFSILTPREQLILRAHYGFGQPALTLREIGEKYFEVSGEAVRLVEKRAIQKLKKHWSTVK